MCFHEGLIRRILVEQNLKQELILFCLIILQVLRYACIYFLCNVDT